jgi:Kef-type K+ transport system membrane component KefB
LLNSSPSSTRTYLYYVILLIMFAAGIWFILARGSHLNANRPADGSPTSSVAAPTASPTVSASTTAQTYLSKVWRENLRSPLSILLLQIIVIIIVARLFAAVFRKIGQPPVMGEMVAGIVLGPSVLGLLSPQTMALLFPPASMAALSLLSQIGVVLFMFVVGMELDLEHLREKATAAIMISHASIVVPFLLGAALALFIYTPLAPANTSFTAFALFMGIAMSITAFPVLARIIQEHGLTRSQLGTMAITCAAVNDVTGWCLLAVVVGLVQSGTGAGAVWTIALAVLYMFFMLFVLRPFLRRRSKSFTSEAQLSPGLLAFAVIALLLSAWITEIIGIHALFGAFLMGVAIPEHNGFKEKLNARIHDVTTVILLPLFFAFTGLRTQVGLLDDAQSWLICALVLLVAVLGKFGGAALAARFTGHSWRTSCTLGALMNTRGLMELIVLNIGYDLGILSPKIFTMMVIMAVVTTMMAGPTLRLMNREYAP